MRCWLLVGAVGLSGCAQGDLVLARDTPYGSEGCFSEECSGSGSGGAGFLGWGELCEPFSGHCAEGLVCAPLGCDLVEGSCEWEQLDCEAALEPTCGCSGITYWNPCLLQRAFDAPRNAGPCVDEAVPCGDFPDAPCDAGRACLQLDLESCTVELPGRCWELPETQLGPVFSACEGPRCVESEVALIDPTPSFFVDPSCPE